MDTSRKIESKKIVTSSLFKLTLRTSLFLFLSLMVLILLFVAGNYQKFLDVSQSFILKISSVVAVASCFFYVLGIVQTVIRFFSKHGDFSKKTFIIYFVAYLVAFFISLICIVLFRTVDILSTGI